MLPFNVYKYIYDVVFGEPGEPDDNQFLMDILEKLSNAYPLSNQEESVVKAGAPQYSHELDKITSERLKKFTDIIDKGIYEDKILEKEVGKEFIYVNKNVLLPDSSRNQLLGYTSSLMNIDNVRFELPTDVAIYLNTQLNLELANPDQLKFKNLSQEQRNKIKKFAKDLNEKLKSRTSRLSETEEQFIRGLDPMYAYDLDTVKTVALYNYQPWQKVFTEQQMKFLTSTAYNLENLVKGNSLNREQNEALASALSDTLVNPEHLLDKTLLDNDDLYYIREFAQDLAYNAALYLEFTPEQELFINSLGNGLGLAVQRYKQEKQKWQDSLGNKYDPGKQIANQTMSELPQKINITNSSTPTQPIKNINQLKRTSSFSGSDAVISLVFPNSSAIVVGTASTVTYSTYRQLAQIRTIGRQSSKGYARGGITYAGTIIFTVINQSFIHDLKANVPYLNDLNYLRPDQLPPFDINISYGNEYGQTASMTIYGATFVDETMTISVEDMFTENVLTFIARDIRHLKENEGISGVSSVKFRAKDEILSNFIETPKKTVQKPAVTNQPSKPSEPAKNSTSSNSSQPSTPVEATKPVETPKPTQPAQPAKPASSEAPANQTNQNQGNSIVNSPKTNPGNITPPTTSTKKLVVIKLTVQDKSGTKIKGATVALKLNGKTIKNGSGKTDKNGVVQFSNIDIGVNKIFQVVIDAVTYQTLNESLDIRSKENNKIIQETLKLTKTSDIKIRIEKDNYSGVANKTLTKKGLTNYDEMPRIKVTGMPLNSSFEINWRLIALFKPAKTDKKNYQVVVVQDYLSPANNAYKNTYVTSSFRDCFLVNTKEKSKSNKMSYYVDFDLSNKFPHPILNSKATISSYYTADVIKDSTILNILDKIVKRKEVDFTPYTTIEISLMASIEQSSFNVTGVNIKEMPKAIVTFKFTVNK